MVDKELALAFAVENAPTEVKDAATAHRESYFRMIKAKAQIDLWYQEAAAAEKAYQESQRLVRKSIEAWDPAGINTAKIEEMPK